MGGNVLNCRDNNASIQFVFYMLYYYICYRPKQHLESQDDGHMKAWDVFGSPMCDCFDGARDVSRAGRALRHGGVEPHLKRSEMR